MFKRAVVIAAVLAGAIAPAAQAQSTLVVQATAITESDGHVTFTCAAWDVATTDARLDRCSFGNSTTWGTKGFPVGWGTATVQPGGSYELCVAASSHPLTGAPVSVSKCAPYDHRTAQVVIGP